jgi:hypothetical protein
VTLFPPWPLCRGHRCKSRGRATKDAAEGGAMGGRPDR